MIYSEIFGEILICLSEKYFVIITLNKSSVGKSIPKLTKLSILDFKSFKLYLKLFIGRLEFITTKISNCFVSFNIE